MNREIKFRGKRTDTGEWVYGNLIKMDGSGSQSFIVPYCHGASTIPCVQLIAENLFPVEIETVGQCANLKDINGKSIYEGDILTCKDYPFQDEGEFNYNAEVFWSEVDSQFCIELHCVNSKKSGISNGICEGLTERGTEFEIIGNIWDNPELLEVQQ